MRIVTIAREMGAIHSAQETALCRAIGLRDVHRDTLEKRFRMLGTDPEHIDRFDERKPRLMDSFLGRPNIYWETLQTAILQEAQQGDVALVGRGANFLLSDIVRCFRIRFVAPPEVRAERVARRLNCSQEQALDCIRKSDRERIGFCYYFYGKKWQDANAYDLTVNTAEISLSTLEEVLPKFLERSEVTAQEEAKLRDSVLQQFIRYTLLVKEKLEFPFLDVKCEDGNVTVHGAVFSQEAHDKIESIIPKIEGVRSLKNQLRLMQNNIPLEI